MGKKSILIFSILSIVTWFINELIKDIILENFHPIKIISTASMIILWGIVIYLVFIDVKKRGKPTFFAALAFFGGGIGGIAYYALIYKESDDNLKEIKDVGMSKSSKKNLIIFNTTIAILFGLVFLISFPYSRPSYVLNPLSITFGILTILPILILIMMRNK